MTERLHLCTKCTKKITDNILRLQNFCVLLKVINIGLKVIKVVFAYE